MANPDSDPQPFLELIESKDPLSNRFSEIRRIGRAGGGGAFSLLFQARDSITGKMVALKFFDPSVQDTYRRDSFLREHAMLGLLQDEPDVIQKLSGLMEFTESLRSEIGIRIPISFSFFAVELATCDLSTLLDHDDFEAADKLKVFRVMCRSIQRIHRRGIVHRDIKPSNFLIMGDNTVRLSDLGTARELRDQQRIAPRYFAPLGDCTYASLETLACLHDISPEISYSADMYALGAVLFEMFTGIPLNLHLFEMSMLASLNSVMAKMVPAERIREFHKAIGQIANSNPLPDVRDFGTNFPRSIAPILNRMYSQLAALDYRKRNTDFSATFLQIDQCLLVLRNEQAYSRWLQRKRLIREANEAKRLVLKRVRETGAN
jgi:serine/threonine protein kinase